VRSLSKSKLTAALFIGLVVALVAGAVPALAFDHSANESAMLRLIDHARARRGLHRLAERSALDAAALSHARQMIRLDYFSHSSQDGTTMGARVRDAGYGSRGWSGWSAGEVIAWGSGAKGTPRAIFTAWMHSPSHRGIILGKRWRDVGLGCARGVFKGVSGVTMFTVDLGRRVR